VKDDPIESGAPNRLQAPLRHQALGGHGLQSDLNDAGAGAVVTPQMYEAGGGEILLKTQEEFYLRAPETIDGLIRVPDGA